MTPSIPPTPSIASRTSSRFQHGELIIYIRQVREFTGTTYSPNIPHKRPEIDDSLALAKKIDHRLDCIFNPKPPADCP